MLFISNISIKKTDPKIWYSPGIQARHTGCFSKEKNNIYVILYFQVVSAVFIHIL